MKYSRSLLLISLIVLLLFQCTEESVDINSNPDEYFKYSFSNGTEYEFEFVNTATDSLTQFILSGPDSADAYLLQSNYINFLDFQLGTIDVFRIDLAEYEITNKQLRCFGPPGCNLEFTEIGGPGETISGEFSGKFWNYHGDTLTGTGEFKVIRN